MGTVHSLKSSIRRATRLIPPQASRGEVVIFPGVRIERHDLDLSHRVRDSAGDDFDGLGDGDRLPRKTS